MSGSGIGAVLPVAFFLKVARSAGSVQFPFPISQHPEARPETVIAEGSVCPGEDLSGDLIGLIEFGEVSGAGDDPDLGLSGDPAGELGSSWRGGF